MTWPKVLLLAVASAIVTSVFLLVPVFKNTSFERMGVYVEAWIFLAVIIMANCEKPLESGLKTFVFFLVSQPLIYLIQVPFSSMGWGLFGYYGYWFVATLLTFPAAFAGWYIRKKNWLSLLILSPALIYLAIVSADCFAFAFAHFPYRLVAAVFCLLQILLYLAAFTSNFWQKLTGALVPLIVAVVLLIPRLQVQVNNTRFLPDDPVLSESATVQMEQEEGRKTAIDVTIEKTGTDSMVRIQATQYGSVAFSIQDGETVYSYSVTVYEDNAGHSQVDITKR